MTLTRSHYLLAAAIACFSCAATAQVQAVGRFMASKPDPGWSFTGTPALTAPGVDPEGSGWLRLTGNTVNAAGSAVHTRGTFNALRGLRISFSYASWGGGNPGADGIALFLFDAKANMTGAAMGGGLGYCKGAGAWLGLALDEYGNFSHPDDGCSGGGGPGQKPDSLVLRGPTSAKNPFVASAQVPGGIDRAEQQSRPQPAYVVMTLLPKPAQDGFVVTVDWRGEPGGPWNRLLNQVDFPYRSPGALSLGISGSTGGARNIHEVRELMVTANNPPTIAQNFDPPVVSPGSKSTLVFHFGSTANASANLVETFTHRLPAGIKIASPPKLGGTCFGAVHAAPGSETIIVERGSTIMAAGCTVAVDVVASGMGRLDSVIASGSVATDQGVNLTPSSATLTVQAVKR